MQKDREEIMGHIHALFQAFHRKDRKAVRRGHTEDWRGFQIRSRHLVRGLDDYMKAADAAMQSVTFSRYEIQDVEVQIYGEIAIVYYVAQLWLPNESGAEITIQVRSVDIYRKGPEGWNQCGSNICLMPEEAKPAK